MCVYETQWAVWDEGTEEKKSLLRRFPVKASKVVGMKIGLLRLFKDQCVSGL